MQQPEAILTFLSNALSETDSRDSLTEILQYGARLWAGILPSQELPARRVYKSLSKGRKIFRLFRFIPETLYLIQQDDENAVIRALSRAQSLLSILFYSLDNWVYLLETVKRKSRGDIRPIKYIKNRISLLRILVSITLTLVRVHVSWRESKRKDEGLILGVRLWHESLRLWLTLHKLHLIELFVHLPGTEVKPNSSDRHRFDVLPGAIGLVSAITGFIRRTSLRS